MEPAALLGRRAPREGARAAALALPPGQLAWIAALPCALVTAAAVVVLGPVVGNAFLAPGDERIWPPGSIFAFGQAEPEKHGRYVVALLGPLLLAAVVLVLARRRVRLRSDVAGALVATSQLLLCAAVAGAMLGQRRNAFTSAAGPWRIFSVPTLVVALAAPALLLAAVRAPGLMQRLAALRHDTRRRQIACLAVAAGCTVLWLLPAIVTEGSIANGPFPDLAPWAMGDTYAILDGRTPLVDFHPLYGHLWAYVAAVPMALLGSTMGTFTTVMATISGAALLAVYALLRRIVRSSAAALVLYLPLLATSFFVVANPALTWRMTNSGVYSAWPIRCAGPLLLAWLTARHLDGAAPRQRWLLFLVAGLVVLNNLEFGLGALGGTLLALGCAQASWSWRALGRLAASAVAGLLGALLVVAAITLVRAGALPRLGLLLEFPHLFGVLGLAALPTPLVGFYLVLYATFAAALAVAAVRVARREADELLTGMLAWSGVFGLVAGSYFIGRSDALKLAAVFPAWSLALMLLTVVVVRGLAAREWRRPSPAELLVAFGFGLAACSLAQVTAPWHELTRVRAAGAPRIYAQPEAHRFVDRTTRPGEHVVILIPMGHRIAYDLGLVNVSPYGFLDEIATREQMRTLLEEQRRGDAHKLYVLAGRLAPEHRQVLARAGFAVPASEAGYDMWSDGQGRS